MLPPLQEVAAATHPLAGTAAKWLWLVPILPLLGFLINGVLSLAAAFKLGVADPSAAHGDGHDGHEVAHAHDEDHEAGHDEEPHAMHRHRFAAITSIVGPAVLILSFIVAASIWVAVRGAGEMHEPFIQRYFSWIATGDLKIDAAFQLDQLSMVMTLV